MTGHQDVGTGGAVRIGEAFVGEGVDAAHINTVCGPRDGAVGIAWATALATPSVGHAPFMAVVAPGVPAKPPTLFVNKAAIADETHGRLTWGAAQAGVASGVVDAVSAGHLPTWAIDTLALIVAVWVNPDACDPMAVYRNNRRATYEALAAGSSHQPDLSEVLAAARHPHNPYFTPDPDPDPDPPD